MGSYWPSISIKCDETKMDDLVYVMPDSLQRAYKQRREDYKAGTRDYLIVMVGYAMVVGITFTIIGCPEEKTVSSSVRWLWCSAAHVKRGQ